MIESNSVTENKASDTSPAESTPRSKNKSADRPHLLSLVLSIVAVCLSCLSLYESHASRHLNEELSRSIVSVNGVKTLADLEWSTNGKKIKDIPVEISITNAGKSLATLSEPEIYVGIECKSEHHTMVSSHAEMNGIPAPRHLAPGTTETFTTTIAAYMISKEKEGNDLVQYDTGAVSCNGLAGVRITITTEYSDMLGRYVDHACFRIFPIDKRLIVNPGWLRRCDSGSPFLEN
jgi:hypothetical protein